MHTEYSLAELQFAHRGQFGSPAICTQSTVWQSCSLHSLLGSVQLSADSHQFADHVRHTALVTLYAICRVQFSSVLDGNYALGKAIYAPPHPSEVSPKLPLKQFHRSSDFQERSSSVSSFHAPLLQAIDGVRDVLGFVPAGSVSSSSTLQIFREASYL